MKRFDDFGQKGLIFRLSPNKGDFGAVAKPV
jgi:hypothetical protein